jgi:hypothetical protein
MPMDRNGCEEEKFFMWKKPREKVPIVDLALILGGEATTLEIVSRMEVREGRIGSPEMVVSQ